jgi:hypothetical protein
MSAETGIFTFFAIDLIIPKCLSKSILIHHLHPSELAIPQLVVPIALNPTFSRDKADSKSQAFPKIKYPLMYVACWIPEFCSF